jgi:hypothetical protein
MDFFSLSAEQRAELTPAKRSDSSQRPAATELFAETFDAIALLQP